MRAVELFAGAGGLAMGAGKAGFKPAMVVEWDRWCCDTIRENRAEGNGSWTEAMRQLGNAVPVELARVLGKNVAAHLKRPHERARRTNV